MRIGQLVARWIVIIAAIAVVSVAGGCAGMNDNERMSMAEQALEEKYGEKFTAIDVEDMGELGFRAWLRPKALPECVVRTVLNQDGSGLVDNYVPRRLCHQITDKAEWAMKDYSGCFYIYTGNIEEFVSEKNKDIDVEGYLATHNTDRFDLQLYAVKEELDPEALYKGVEAIRNQCGVTIGVIHVCVVEDNKLKKIQKSIEEFDEADGIEFKELTGDSSSVEVPFSKEETMPEMSAFVGGLRR